MNRKSITQEYFILVTNEQGNFPTMRKDETKSGKIGRASCRERV